LNDSKLNKRELKGLAVFDVEGVLLPKRRYIPFEVTRRLGILKILKIILFGFLYEIGLLTLEASLKRIYGYFKGYSVEELRYYYRKMPLLPGSEEVLEFLRKNGWKTALISSGLPHIFIKELANKLKADYAFGLELVTINGKFTGEIRGDVIKKNGKAIVLKEVLRNEGISPQNCILVADDRNNLPMFPYASLKIGYNPDFMLSAKSDYVVTGSLDKVLPIITKKEIEKSKQALSKNQILRSAIHISGFTIPFICTYLLDCHLLTFLTFLITFLYIMSELARIVGISFPLFNFITTRAAVKQELYEFATAPVFYAFGIALSLIIFHPPIGYASIAILTLGDGFASLFSKKFGKTPYPFNKSKHLEGSIFGFIFAFSGAIFFIDPIKASVGAIIGMLVECFPIPIDDNLMIPLAAGTVLSLAYL
jgi:phosphoserine phosphatase